MKPERQSKFQLHINIFVRITQTVVNKALASISNLNSILLGTNPLLRWRKEGSCLLRKQQKQIEELQKQIETQSRLLKLVADATGIKVEEES